MRQVIVIASVLIGGLLIALGPIGTANAPLVARASATAVLPTAVLPAAVLPAAVANHRSVSARGGAHWHFKQQGWSRSITRGGQAEIDRCKATLYSGSLPGNSSEPAWLAGHDYCGFWRWDERLTVGSRFRLTTPTGAVLKYVVFGRDTINRKSGPSDGLIHGDITLQTCRGSKTTFAYARRLN